MPDSSSNDNKVPKLQNSKCFALWRVYVMELMRKDGVLNLLREDPPDPNTASNGALARFQKEDQKARPHIVLNLGEEPATMITSLLLSGATTEAVWDKLIDNYQKGNIQTKLNLRSRLHSMKLTDEGKLQDHLTQLEQIFVDLARINDPVAPNE